MVKELLNSCGWMNVSDQICNVSVIIVQYQVRPEDSTRRSYSKNKRNIRQQQKQNEKFEN